MTSSGRGAFTGVVGCDRPLQLAGMGGGVSDVALAGAVSSAGGFGMLGAGGLPVPVLEEMLDAMADASSPPFGVNFLMPFLDPDAVAVAAARCRLVEFFYADPDAELVELVHSRGALASWQVGSASEARAAVGAGCDIVIVQGTEAGGHVRGTATLADVLRETIGAVSIPIVAAGGIGSAEQVKSAIDAGASAVRVGTRFLAAAESAAHPDYIEALIEAKAEDTVLTTAFSVGWPDAPHRVLRSCVAAAEASSDEVVGTTRAFGSDSPVPRFASVPPSAATAGNIAAMALYAGTSVDAVRDRRPAAEIVSGSAA